MTVTLMRTNDVYFRLMTADATVEATASLIENVRKQRQSVDARMAEGKALREKVPRTLRANYKPRPGRPDPVGVLEAQNASRIPKLVRLRHSRMLARPLPSCAARRQSWSAISRRRR